MFKTAIRCYCAFCRSERSVYRKKHLSLVDAVMGIVASLSAMMVVWQDFDPRVFVLIGISLCLTELFIGLRWRLSIACTRCGFDPVLYKRNPELAASRVRAHMERSKEDPLSLFNPPPKLPVLKKKAASKNNSGQRLSIRT
jgi:hypothetical protein